MRFNSIAMVQCHGWFVIDERNLGMFVNIPPFNVGGVNTFVIAEIGNNHNGCLKRAFNLIDAARRAGADCVKFQMRDVNSLYRADTLSKKGEDLAAEYTIDLLNRYDFNLDQHFEVYNYCKKNEILYLCSPWDIVSAEVLESFGVTAYKVASADMTNFPLLDRLCETNKPLIISTGMSSREEIEETVKYLNQSRAKFVLLHCNSTYPAPFSDINLKWMHELLKLHPLIGYSGHERGIAVSIAAVALGAKVIERHLTFDKSLEGPDHNASLLPEEFSAMVAGIREVESALGSGSDKLLSQGEMINRENLGKSIVAARDLVAGYTVKREDLAVKSPGLGISPNRLNCVVGLKLRQPKKKDDYFFESDISLTRYVPRNFKFRRPWGIPVRYHDFEHFNSICSPDIWEFHLSYSDLYLDFKQFLPKKNPGRLVVHAPELFENGHLLDLASSDEDYRMHSVNELQNIVNLTRELNIHFKGSSTPQMVVNMGGFSVNQRLNGNEKLRAYDLIENSLKKLDSDSVEILPQTMAPFPWHFGGQRYQNLFIDPIEIVESCSHLGLRLCLDVSHSFLACNEFGWSFDEFIQMIAPLSAHLHLGDAKGVNGEGLQIGLGEIDFVALCALLDELCPRASFIPEIWQGHKDNGYGFWLALNRLEKFL